MTNFTELLSKTIVASSPYGVTTSEGFKNVAVINILPMLRQAQLGSKDGTHFLRTALLLTVNGDCLPRSNNNTSSMANLLILDCDKRINQNGEVLEGAPNPHKISQVLRENNIGHVLYGSHSHYVGNKGNRYRIIVVTKIPYKKEQLKTTLEAIISNINVNLGNEILANATENFTWAQPWYYPRKPAYSAIEHLYIEHLNGEGVGVIEPVEMPSISKTPNRTFFSSYGEISPIHAFNEQYSLEDILIQYGYKKIYVTKEYQKWLKDNSSTGAPGITVKDNKFYSHHGSCPFNDGYWHDAFDLMRISERLSPKDAVIKAAKNTLTPDGRTVDEHNKSLVSKKNRGGYAS